MIKRHKKVFYLLVGSTILFNIVGLILSFIFGIIDTLLILDAVLLLGLLMYNMIFNNYNNSKLRKQISRDELLRLKEKKSMIWIGIYSHLGLSIICIIICSLTI